MRWRERALLMAAFVSLAAGLDRRSVPGTSYIDWKFGDKQEENTTTTTSTLSETTDNIDPVTETSHIGQEKDEVETGYSTMESDEATTIMAPAGPGKIEKIDLNRSGVPGTSYIDREKETVILESNTMKGEESTTSIPPVDDVSSYLYPTSSGSNPLKANSTMEKEKDTVISEANTMKGEKSTTAIPPTASPVKANITMEKVDVDRTGVPGTSYIDREKDVVVPESITMNGEKSTTTISPTTLSVKANGTIEKVDVDLTAVPDTSYIDREKDTVSLDSNTTADIVFPVVTDNASVNKEQQANKDHSLSISKTDEPHFNKKKYETTELKTKLTSNKKEEMRKKEKGEKVNSSKSKRSIIETNKRKTKKSNSELLNHLGLRKLKMPAVNHHRKRLASQSRKAHRHTSAADSKMFVIKLPPEPYYYAHHDENEVKKKPVNTLPVSFSSNGKPSRVYHWNIPVMKKMVARKAGSPKAAMFADSDVFNIDKQATWNDSGDEKPYHTKTAFYAPHKASKEAFRKYFSGNGKPHSFYVMSKSKSPISTYRLLP